jgi:hypothetical protein
MASGLRDGAPRVVWGAFPSALLGRRALPFHHCPVAGDEPLPTRMWAAALHHARVVRELTMQEAVSSTVKLVLGRLHGETTRVEVMNELTAKFQELVELCWA